MIAYADTSFLFSLYFPDAHAQAATRVMRRTVLPILSSDLGQFEFTNAICGRIFMKDITAVDAQDLAALLSKDIASGVVRVAPLSSAVFVRATQIALAHTAKLGVRALDVLHVASALVQQADTFYTFDRRQSKLAVAVGLKTP